MTLTAFLEHFAPVRKMGKNYVCECKAHDDKSRNTLHIAIGADGRRLVNCRAGCRINEVLGAHKLKARDLFDDVGTLPKHGRRPPRPQIPDDDATWTPAQLDAYQRTHALELLQRARAMRPKWDLIRLSEPIRRGWRIVDDARRHAAALGPDDPTTDALLTYAAAIERHVFRLEAEQDARAREPRRT